MLTRRFGEAKAGRVGSRTALEALEQSASATQKADWATLEAKAKADRLSNLRVMESYEVQLQKCEYMSIGVVAYSGLISHLFW